MKLKKLLIVVLCILPALAFARPADQLRSILHSINSIQADFKQSLFNGRGKVLQATSGKMSIARPGRFRWQVSSPTKQLIVANGKKLYVYDQSLKQVTVQPLKRGVGNTPAMILSGSSTTLFRSFNIQKIKGWFILVPKIGGTAFRNIKLLFKGNRLIQMNMQDSLGQTSKIRFSSVRVNSRLSRNLFSFSIPKGVDVIRQ